MISIENVTLERGGRTLIADATVGIGSGRVAALIGRNGSGKSTLLRSVAGIERPDRGSVMVNGKDIGRMTAQERARVVSVVTTARIDAPDLTALEAVEMGRAPYTGWAGRLTRADREAVTRAMELTGTSELARRRLESLSDGERQRVMTARALAQATPVMVLDEPTSFLDLPGRRDALRLLRKLAHEEELTVVLSTHELDIAAALCDDILLIDTPRLVAGPAAEVAASDAVTRLFGSLEGI